jgi:hypothetical protein
MMWCTGTNRASGGCRVRATPSAVRAPGRRPRATELPCHGSVEARPARALSNQPLSKGRRVLLIAFVFMFPMAAPSEASSTATLCRGRTTSIVINLKAHELELCDVGRSAATYPVAIGKGGVGKRAQGDNKTPVGRYSLGEARPSGKFGVFIPVGYPTAQQKEQGFTGDNIGIHGPFRGFAWAGAINTWIDWTQGCIAVAHDGDMAAIAAWAKEHRAEVVELVD